MSLRVPTGLVRPGLTRRAAWPSLRRTDSSPVEVREVRRRGLWRALAVCVESGVGGRVPTAGGGSVQPGGSCCTLSCPAFTHPWKGTQRHGSLGDMAVARPRVLRESALTSGQSLSPPKVRGAQGLNPTNWLPHQPAGGMCVSSVVRTLCVWAWRVMGATPQMHTGPLGGSKADDPV